MTTAWVEEGEMAPDFTAPSDTGEDVTLSRLRGRPVVLYFYPKDDTPGCTLEACAFRDRKDELARRGVALLGVSPDDVASHQRFRDKFQLNFPLLADPDRRIATAYGAWRERERDGKTSLGLQRSTFLIDADGLVRRAWKTVDVRQHDREVLEAVDDLPTRAG